MVAMDNFSILDWWEGVFETLPLLYAIVCRVLALPTTSCDVERCSSSMKWVHENSNRT